MFSPSQKPAIAASVMMGDRDLTSAKPTPEPAAAPAPDSTDAFCNLISRRCIRRATVLRQRRMLPA
jgi:hypothetical protein